MKILSVNISEEKGTIKKPVDSITIDQSGVVGDAHAGKWHRQVSLLSREIIADFEKEMGRTIEPGEFAENITTQGDDLRGVSVLDRFVIGEVELEVTQIGKKCHGDTCAIFREVGKCVMPHQGIFCRVISGGTVKAGDSMEYRPRPLAVTVVTVSDRASRGEYEDLSGAEIVHKLNEHFAETRWHLGISAAIVPDEACQIEAEINAALESGADIIITTGGTGVGPRDVTPDVVAGLLDKQLPGIMESIRTKYGAEKPNALLSRSIAGIAGMTQVYTLPGSVKAVQEYMTEILKTVEHLITMLNSIDSH